MRSSAGDLHPGHRGSNSSVMRSAIFFDSTCVRSCGAVHPNCVEWVCFAFGCRLSTHGGTQIRQEIAPHPGDRQWKRPSDPSPWPPFSFTSVYPHPAAHSYTSSQSVKIARSRHARKYDAISSSPSRADRVCSGQGCLQPGIGQITAPSKPAPTSIWLLAQVTKQE